jgi:hypothetical protein
MRALTAVGIVLLLAGCATAPAATPASGAQTFTGEVWTWDQPNNIVTLYKEGRAFRVKTTPDQMRTLQLHSNAKVTGELAPPAELVTVITAAGTNPVPRGQAEVLEVQGTVASVDPSGRIAVTSDRGPVHVWAAAGADQRFAKGSPVLVKMSVQPVDMVAGGPNQPAASASANASATALASASPTSEPGDHAVITGRIIGVNPGGVLVVESPTGPVQVLVNDGSRYKVGEFVQIRTTVRAAS